MSVSVRHVDFNYRCFPVLHDVTFEASPGNLVCVMGENGAGKSTLFRCILGLLRPEKGKILLNGDDVAAMPARVMAGKAAYIPQSQPWHFSYSAFEIVLMGASAGKGMLFSPGREQEAIAENALIQLGIHKLAHRNFSHLSGGERQMVLIARALAQRTKILVLDEPCSGLDYGNQIRVMECVKALAQQGYLILLSTHNPQIVFLYADLALVLSDGRIRCFGHPNEVIGEALLEEIYGIPVRLYFDEDKCRYVCLPK